MWDDPQQPGAPILPMKSAEEPERPQIRLLHHVFGIRLVVRQPTRQIVSGVEVRQYCSLKTGEFVLLLQSVFLS